jgi:hypothetical protein
MVVAVVLKVKPNLVTMYMVEVVVALEVQEVRGLLYHL